MTDIADRALMRLQAMAMARGAFALLQHIDSDERARRHLENAVTLLEEAVCQDRDTAIVRY